MSLVLKSSDRQMPSRGDVLVEPDIDRSVPDYVTGFTFEAFLAMLRARHPNLYRLLDRRCEDPDWVSAEVRRLNDRSWEFEGTGNGGRGTEYNLAQRNVGNRRVGMTKLLALFGADDDAIPGPATIIHDVLAGEGTLRRFAERFVSSGPEIFSSDLSRLMVEACLAQGYPCIRQSASQSLFGDGTLDGVLIAYGSHHLVEEDRARAACEAHRTLKPGGKFVLHDFETGGPVDLWFRTVVDAYSATGHPHPHFSRCEMGELLAGAGFSDVRVRSIEDPFILHGKTARDAHRAMLAHLHLMYGLVKLPLVDEIDWTTLDTMVAETLGRIEIKSVDGRFEATLMRHALVAVGVKAPPSMSSLLEL